VESTGCGHLADYVEMKKRQGQEAGEAMRLLDDLDYMRHAGPHASDEEEERGYHYYQDILERNYGPGKYQYNVTNGSKDYRLGFIRDVMTVLKEYFKVDPGQILNDALKKQPIQIPEDHPRRTRGEETITFGDMFINKGDSDATKESRIFKTSIHTFKQTRNDIKKQGS
jgi:hypothetical protein